MEALPCLFFAPFSFSRHNFRYESGGELNLANFTEEELKPLKDEIDSVSHVRGMKSISKDISVWLSLREDPNQAKEIKMSAVKKAFDVFFHRMMDMPRKHIYQKHNELGESRWLPFYVEKFEYIRADRYDPEHLTFHLVCIDSEQRCKSAFSAYHPHIYGKTVDQAFEKCGYRLENPILRGDYEFEMERYESVVDKIGKQFWCTGTATNAGVDSYETGDNDRSWSWYRSAKEYQMEKDGVQSQVVVDVIQETDSNKEKRRSEADSDEFWRYRKIELNHDDEIEGEEEDESSSIISYPVHPYVTIFDLRKQTRLSTHVMNLTEYVYNSKIRDSLILPDDHRTVIDSLLHNENQEFEDVVKNKSGGIIILSQGPPGTGKTLTSEIYAEVLEKPLYTVQCSQLGLTVQDLEKNLVNVLKRGKRWKAVTLLDEADVYVHQRGSDLHQNAIVGVFLRVLEYHTGILFMTTNRGDLVDDAVLSRCTIRIPYDIPSKENQELIWRALLNSNNLDPDQVPIKDIVERHNDLSGRDIKNLLKLILLVHRDPKEITSERISQMRIYKPTTKI